MLSAHLLIPGFVFTPLAAGDADTKPAGAWTADFRATAEVTFVGLSLGKDFYILCPDEDGRPRVGRKADSWAAGDIINNRPPLSRWHPEYKALFDAFVEGTREPAAHQVRRRATTQVQVSNGAAETNNPCQL